MMNQHNTRAAWLGATVALILAASGGAVADNAAPTTAPTTTDQPSQQQTGVTAPVQAQPSATGTPASATASTPAKEYPTRIWIKRSERGTNTHGRGQSH